MKALFGCGEFIQSHRGHRRAEVRAANADVDDIRDAVIFSHALCKGQHRVQNSMNVF